MRLCHLQGVDESAASTRTSSCPLLASSDSSCSASSTVRGFAERLLGVISLLRTMTSSNCLWADSLRAPDYYHEQHDYPTAILSLIYAPRARVSTCHESVSFL